MRLAISGVTDEDLELALQVGATDAVGGGSVPTDKGYYTAEDLTAAARKDRRGGPEAVDHQRAARGADLQDKTGTAGPG